MHIENKARIAILRSAAAARLVAAALAGTAWLPSLAAAQSATNDAGLFSENERFLRFGSSDRNITLAPFIQLDGGYTDFTPGKDFWDTSDNLLRLYVYGTYDQFGGTFAYDFQNRTFPVRYAFVNYSPTDRLTFQVGQQDEPFSLQDYSGSRFLPFATSGQSAALIPGDNVGGVVKYGGDAYSLAGGIFGGDVNTGVDSEGLAFTGRATWAPVYAQSEITRGGDASGDGVGTQRVDRLLHLGAAISTRFDIDHSFGFSGGTNSTLTSRSIAAGPSFDDADQLLRGNLEASIVLGSLSIQGELTGARVEGSFDSGTAHGGYLYSTYFLTGETRGYSRSSGTFGRVVPKNPIDEGGFGAFEIGARIDYLDLTDLCPDGGAQFGASAVANLYLTKRVTLTSDYSYTVGTAGPNDGLTVHALTGRIQFAY
ncbi:porin [Fulvimarina sp. 2208YS6-2-32]|uniref:Porin n=1 Tax=Fulvimarina uroteuthidis TaxID=3098149 RepID=A0ABU5I4Y3_9HYPH|nr:porin [Fulvimarina sp. 2208YS6-2-32]MDY8110429.1 porin [Fulvimarina sp. 2208YS6-2-32]